MPKPKTAPTHGGARTHAGRPPKQDRVNWGRVTCILRKDTIDRLREASDNGRFFGELLQFHLDRFPLPNRAQYLSLRRHGIKSPRIRTATPRTEELSADEKQLPYAERLKLLVERSGDRNKVNHYPQWIANLRARGLTRDQIQKQLGLSRRQLAQYIDPTVKPQPSFTKEVA
jgi:AraC-like DNA-binding protein